MAELIFKNVAALNLELIDNKKKIALLELDIKDQEEEEIPRVDLLEGYYRELNKLEDRNDQIVTFFKFLDN